MSLVFAANLKHKDLTGQIVSSQAYIDQDEDIDKDFVGTGPHDHDTTVSGEGDGETE